MKTKHLYTISLKKWSEKKQGFFLSENQDWILIKSLFSDYIMDGETIINKVYIDSIERGNDEKFIEAVLIANNKLNTYKVIP
ncbi:MAG: hypothetical protein LBT27_07930 [Prevotellaceae bacterium]|jgi:hypothetical protein|nr:hypothetical protein [Prevotellaceae bacterium]